MRRVLVVALAVLAGAALAGTTVLAQGPHPPHGDKPQADAPRGDRPHGGMPHHQMPERHHEAQHHHAHHHRQAEAAAGRELTQPGQDAFAAIAEIVAVLDADPSTDWSRVDLERLRQHLVDMNEVVLRSEVKQRTVPGGLVMEVTGAGRTERAILAMVVPHAAELDRAPAYVARTEPIAGGVRLTVTAENAADGKAVARLRGLGFAGLLTEGAHHRPHHLAMARGERPHAH
jgi:hypothetical protein